MIRALNTAGLSDLEKRVVKATYDDDDPPKQKHVEGQTECRSLQLYHCYPTPISLIALTARLAPLPSLARFRCLSLIVSCRLSAVCPAVSLWVVCLFACAAQL